MNNSSENIEQFLAQLDLAESDESMRQLFDSFSAAYDLNVPADPFSPAYRDKQFSLYEKIAGKSYSPQNEVSTFNVEEAALRPYPYCHGSSELVGDQLMATGFLIKTMGLPPGSRILEFGPGWGNTTLALAKMGYDVTAVDIEKNFVRLIQQRSKMENLQIRVIEGDFSLIKTIQEKFDAVIFFECFHHAQDHLAIMAAFDRVLLPNGIVCFGAEPINLDFPIPWGLRMDGQSIWAIAKNGWLELGFNIDYFREALGRFGFTATDYCGQDCSTSNVIIAKRIRDNFMQRYDFNIGSLVAKSGTLNGGKLLITRADSGIAVHGPYTRLEPGSWFVEIEVDESVPRGGYLIADVVAEFGARRLMEATKISFLSSGELPSLKFSCESVANDFEIRLFANHDCEVAITGVILRRETF